MLRVYFKFPQENEQVYSAFQESIRQFSAEYLPRFLLSDGQFDAALKETVAAFAFALENFNQRSVTAKAVQIRP